MTTKSNKSAYINTRSSRRRFLKNIAAASVLGSGYAAMNGKLSLIGSALAASSDYASLTDYKALVCVFLYGGSDSFNLFVPTEQNAYNSYAQSRGSLGMSQDSLLMPENDVGIGFNPNMPELKSHFDQGNLAVVSNVGNLIAPLTKADYLADSSIVPVDLFAHNHQQEQSLKGMSSLPSSIVASGWGGRMADLLSDANNSLLPPTFTMGGSNPWLPGNASTPISINVNTGVQRMAYMNQSSGQSDKDRATVLSQILNLPQSNTLEQQAAMAISRSVSSSDELITTLASANEIQTPINESSRLANQLRMVARLIGSQHSLGMQRQIFFVGLGGWDTHDNQSARLPGLIAELDESLADFYTTLEELNQQDAVTTFTASDFGRTLTVNGDGSDHGWGGHYMAMGGAVNGGELFGQLPSFITGADDDAGDKGRVIPNLSINQFGASLASWMGLTDNDLLDVFPDLANFGSDWQTGLNLFS